MMKKVLGCVIACIALLLCMGTSVPATAAHYTVLVVMSYGADFEFVQEIKQGIASVLSDTCHIDYFYMDTKKNIAGGPEKAREAYELYRKRRPDGVIAADDNAQAMFVVPYLKDKVKTPVIFCGVNAAPEKYGYPASNVSGILERHQISQSLAFTKLLVPSIKTFGLMTYDSPSGRSVLAHFEREEHTLPVELAAARFPKTLAEAKTMANSLNRLCDVLFIPSMQGLKDDDGNTIPEKKIILALTRAYARPIIGGNSYNIKYGMLCGVIKNGQEQGAVAAEMLLKAMGGTPISQIRVTRNRRGKAVINVTVMKSFGIKPKPILLKDTALVETEP